MTQELQAIYDLIVKQGYACLEIVVPPASRPKRCTKDLPCYYPCEVRCAFDAVLGMDEETSLVTLRYKGIEVDVNITDIVISSDQVTRKRPRIISTGIKEILEVFQNATSPIRIMCGESGLFTFIKGINWEVFYIKGVIRNEKTDDYIFYTVCGKDLSYNSLCVVLLYDD